MKTVLEYLSGKKTYIVAILSGIYAALVGLGVLESQDFIWALLGTSGLASVRAGIAKSAAPVILAATLTAGCVTTGDPAVVRAEQVAACAVEVFDAFLKWEYQNPQASSVHDAAERIRRDGVGWIQTLRTATKDYKASRNDQSKAEVIKALAVAEAEMAEAQKLLAKGAK